MFLDLIKAFDTVDHSILTRKLSSLGVSNESLPWFVSYLTGHLQKTKVCNEVSDVKPITHGVPQGSILGSTIPGGIMDHSQPSVLSQ